MASFNGNVKVCIRARPFIKREQGSDSHWDLDTQQIHLKPGKEKVKSYIFDRVFSEEETTADVYEEIAQPIVNAAMEGFNGTIFAYGQTSSGKTYTMLGTSASPGIIPMAIQEIFETIEKTPEREFLLRVSYLEIYNENMNDLLADVAVPLQIREDEFRSIKVSGLKEEMVTSLRDVMHFMSQGEKNRQMAATNMNERSSRSHTIFRVIIESRERVELNRTREGVESAVRVAQLNLVDLAGSERASQTGSEGQRFKEGCHINKSLMILGQVINQICKENESSSGSTFKNFRDSKLTRILQSSLGGNSLTSIICTVTLAVVEETDSTLRFASSAKQVRNKPIVNEVLSDEALLYRQKREINQLKKKIEEMEQQQANNQQGDVDNLLAEKALLVEKNEKLTRILLVSSLPADYSKKQRMRRETWCPGASRRKTKIDWNFSPLQKRHFLDDFPISPSSFSNEVEAGEVSRLFNDPSLTSMVKRPPDASLVTNRAPKRARFEPDDSSMRNSSDLEKGDSEREKLKLEVRQLSSQVKLQEETIDQFMKEQASAEEDKAGLLSKIDSLSQQVVDLERRDRARSDGDSYLKSLQLEVQDLHGQLRDSCRDNRRLQEQCDSEVDQSRELRVSVEKLNDEIAVVRKEAESKVDEYKEKVTLLQSQLEASVSVAKVSMLVPKAPDANPELEQEIASLKAELDEKNNLIKDVEKQVTDLRHEIDQQKASYEQSVNDLKNELEEAKICKEVMSATLHGTFDGEKTKCLEEAISQCERLIVEREAAKAEFDALKTQYAENKEFLEALRNEMQSKTDEIRSLKEQVDFDASEKEIMLQEEKEQIVRIKMLEEELEMVKNQLLQTPDSGDPQASAEKPDPEKEVTPQVYEERNLAVKLKQEIADLRAELDAASHTSSDSQVLVQDLRHQLSDAGDEVARLKKENEQLMIKQDSLESQVKVVQADLDSYLSMGDMSRRHSSIARSPAREALDRTLVGEMTEKLQSRQTEVDNLSKRLEEYDVSMRSTQSELANKANEISSLLKMLEESKVATAELDDKLKLLSEVNSENEKNISEKDDLISQLTEDLRVSRTTVGATETVEACVQVQDDAERERITGLDQQLQEQQVAAERLKQLLDDEAARATLLDTQLQEERAATAKLREDLASAESSLSSSRRSVDEQAIRNDLADCRKELAKLSAENARLKEEAEQTRIALLAESNKELGIEKQLHLAGEMQKESLASFALQRNAANKEISQLQKQLEDTKQSLQRALSEKDIAQHQSEKHQQKCEELKLEVMEIEKDRGRQYQSSLFTPSGGDTQKLSSKVKQLSLNLDITKQRKEELERANKQLSDENRRLEAELQQGRNALSESKELNRMVASKTEEFQRLQRELDAQRVRFRDAGVDAERQKRALETALEQKTTELEQIKCDLEKAEAAVKSLRIEKDQTEQRRLKTDDELKEVRDRLSEESAALRQKDDAMAKLRLEAEELAAVKENLMAQQTEMTNTATGKEEIIQGLKCDLEKSEARLSSLQLEMESLDKCKQQADEKLQEVLGKLSAEVNAMKQKDQLIENLQQELKVATTIDVEPSLELEKIVAEKDELIQRLQGSSSENEQVIADLRSENDSLKEAKQQVDLQLQQTLDTLATSGDAALENGQLKHDLDKAQTLTHELQLEKESIAQSKEKTAEELRESLSRLSEAEELTNEKEQAVIKLMQDLENMAVVQEDLKQKNIELTDILSQKQNEMARLLGELETARRDLESLRVPTEGTGEAQQVVLDSSDKCEELMDKVRYLEARLREFEQRATDVSVEAVAEKPKKVTFAVSDCEDEMLPLEASMRSHDVGEEAADNLRGSLQREVEQLRTTVAELRDQRLRTDVGIDEHEAVLKQLREEKQQKEVLRCELSELRSAVDRNKEEQMRILENQEHLSESERHFVTLYQEYTQLSGNFEGLKEEKNDLKMRFENLQLEVEKSKDENQRLVERCSELDAEVDRWRSEFSVATERVAHLERVFSAANERLEEQEKTLKRHQETIDQHQQAIDQHKGTSHDEHLNAVEQLERSLSECRQTISEHQQTIDEQKQTLEEYQETIAQHQQTIMQHQQIVDQHQATIEHRDQSIKECKLSIAQQQQTINEYEETIAKYQNTIDESHQKLTDQEEVINKQQAATDQLRSVTSQEATRLDWLEVTSQLEVLRKELHALGEQHSDHRLRDVSPPSSDVLQTDGCREKLAGFTSLNDAIGSVLSVEVNRLKELLKARECDRVATAEKLDDFSRVVSEQTLRNEELESARNKLLEEKESLAKLLTSEQRSSERRAEEISQIEQALAAKTEEAASVETSMSEKLEKSARESDREIARLRAELEDARNKEQRATVCQDAACKERVSCLQEELDVRSLELRRSREESDHWQSQLQNKEGAIAALQSELCDVKGELAAQAEADAALSDELNEKSSLVETLRAERAKAEAAESQAQLIAELRSKHDALVKDAEASANAVNELTIKCKELEVQRNAAVVAQRDVEEEMKVLFAQTNDVKELKEVNLCISEKLVQTESQLEEVEEKLNTALKQNEAFRNQVVLLSEEVEELREKNSGFESALEKAIEESKVEIQSLVESSTRPLQEALDAANQQLKEKDDKIADLTKQLQETGEEYEECSRKHGSLYKKINEMDRSFERIEDENDGLKEQVEQYKKENKKLVLTAHKLAVRLKSTSTAGSITTRSQASCSSSTPDVKQLQDNFKVTSEAYEQQVAILLKQLKASQAKVEAMKSGASSEEYQQLKTDLETAKLQMQEKEKELENVREKLKSTEEEYEECSYKHGNLYRKINEMDRSFERIEDENDGLKAKVEQYEKEIKVLQDTKRKCTEAPAAAPIQPAKKGPDADMEKLRAVYEQQLKRSNALQEKLKLYEEKMFRMKEQMRVQSSEHNQSIADKRIASGGIVQLTKLDIQERDMARLKGKLQHSEKELAKYKDIEVKRRGENQELLDQNKKLRSYVARLRKQPSLPASSESVLQPASHPPEEVENPDEGCTTQ